MIRTSFTIGLILFLTMPVFAGETGTASNRGTVYGIIIDNSTGDPLPGASVFIKNTNYGSATDVEGRFRIRRIPTGDQTMVVHFVGFQRKEIPITVHGAQSVEYNVNLEIDILELEGINIVAQAVGQGGAFNKQRNAPNIVTIVSDEQIQRFPDQNVSDALRRMPGISTEEFRGEATAMYIRGMAPGLNTVTLDGERLPTTSATDRDVSLVGISSDIVGALEVTKAITPAMDADAVGGSVNLVATRPVGNQEIFSISASGGWHDHAGFGNPKASAHFGRSYSNWSYIVRANVSRENRRMDDIRHFWSEQQFSDGNGTRTIDRIDQMRIGAYEFQSDRYAVSSRIDYRINNDHSLFVRGLYNLRDKRGIRHQFRVRPDRGDIIDVNGSQYMIEGVRLEPIGRRNHIKNSLSSFTLGGNSMFSRMNVDYSITYAHGRLDQPYQEYLRFRRNNLDMTYDYSDPNSARINWVNGSESIISDPSNFTMTRYENRTDDMRDNDINSRINFSMPYDVGDFAGTLSFGGRFFYKHKERAHLVEEYNSIDGVFTFDQVMSDDFHRTLVGDRYQIFHYVDWSKGDSFVRENRASFLQDSEDVVEQMLVSDPADYEASEQISAGYVMTTLERNNWLFLAGVRTEATSTTYEGNRTRIISVDENDNVQFERERMSTSSNYINFFPMAHVRYNIGELANIRLAWTNAIARPSFTNLAPYEIANYESETLRRGNPDLQASRVMNFDLMYERYFRSIGVLSAGVFHKRLQDFIFEEVSTEQSGVFEGYEVRMPQNGTTAEVWGAEFAWQQRLHFLPGVLSGLGIYSNYTWATSTAQLRIDREVELPRQIPHVINAALTYERGGFYGMVSYNYQSTYLYQISTTQVSAHRSHLFPSNDRYMRWQDRLDITARYQLTGNIQIFADLRNITNSPQLWYDGNPDYHYRSSFNHMNATMGVRFNR